MEILRWDDSLLIGVVQIDNEHRLLCAMMNDLVKIADAGQEIQAQVLAQSLADLLDASRRHFASEERFLDEVGYPDCAAHQQMHHVLEERLERLRASRDLVVNAELSDFLRNWFFNHIQNEDQKYVAFLKSR